LYFSIIKQIVMTQKQASVIIKDVVPKCTITVRDEKTLVVYPGIVRPTYLSYWAKELKQYMPDSEVSVGTSGIMDGRIIVKL